MYIIIGLLAVIFGIIFIIRPETEYELFQWWKSDGEPSDFYLKLTKIGAYASVVIGAALIIVQLFFIK